MEVQKSPISLKKWKSCRNGRVNCKLPVKVFQVFRKLMCSLQGTAGVLDEGRGQASEGASQTEVSREMGAEQTRRTNIK